MNLVVAAPLQGWAAPLSEVPDTVFADRLMGDGLAIDPTGKTLHAPFDGEIVSLPRSGHALVIRSDAGVEMLMHVGLETVALAGEGFIAHVCEGQRVSAGDRLLSFDLDLLAQRAKSLITPIVVTNGERFDIVVRAQDRRIKVGDALMELRPCTDVGADQEARREITLNFAHGLHARPAATVARVAQRFASDVAINAGARRANAKSPVSLMTLGAKQGDRLIIEARGADAATAAEAVAAAAAAHEARHSAGVAAKPVLQSEPGIVRGVCASAGVAVGVVVKLTTPKIAVTESGRGVELERAALARARAAVRARIEASAGGGDRRRRDIMSAHLVLLDDPELAAAAERLIAAGKSAAFAWTRAISEQAEALGASADAYLADRAADLRDIEQQILSALGGNAKAEAIELPERAIVLAQELLPSQFAALDKAKVAGICTEVGGATSHVALLAQSHDIPMLAGAGGVMMLENGAPVVLDADHGLLRTTPSEGDVRGAEAAMEQRKARAVRAKAHAADEARTADGVRIHVFANLGAAEEGTGAVGQGAEGCGLLRTEFLFMDRQAPPSEDEQFAQYQAIADALDGRTLVIRTLDAGADKPVAYLESAPEANPALGLRGLRASLRRPDLLRTQLRAIMRVEPGARILLPMVNDVAEIAAVRALLSELGARLDVKLGAMIETPSAAMLADQLAAHVDFLSIGTNDLAQYALAMDRGHPDLASEIDPLHPAVLRLIARAAEAGRGGGRSVSVCGAAASDPLAALLLIGLGVDTLSVSLPVIAEMKARLRRVRLNGCREAAAHALTLPSAVEVRHYAASLWSEVL